MAFLIGLVMLFSASVVHADCVGDANHDGQVTVDEVIQVIRNDLYGCMAETPTPQLPNTSTPTETFTATVPPTPAGSPTRTQTPHDADVDIQ